jgi:hypothetical protein
LLKSELYYSFLLSILLFVSLNILFYEQMVDGEKDSHHEDDKNNDDVKQRDNEKEEDENGDSDNHQNDDIPFILPFNPVPFP